MVRAPILLLTQGASPLTPSCGASRRAKVSALSSDATPTIADSNVIQLNGTVTITDFDDGEIGDVIYLRPSTSTAQTITDASNLNLAGSQNWNMMAGDVLALVMDADQTWHEVSRKYNNPQTKFKTADETLTSSTLADDTHLVDWNLAPNTYYKLEGYLWVVADAASRDLEIDIVTDNAFVEEMYTFITVDSGSALTVDEGETQALTTAVAVIDIDGTGAVGILIRGTVLTHATSVCNVDFQFANQAGAGTVTVQKGSWVSFEPVI
jgi:hypothetical protein